jgi:ABC-type sugar transport system permease subunit/outer membrane protein assembly factor BamB
MRRQASDLILLADQGNPMKHRVAPAFGAFFFLLFAVLLYTGFQLRTQSGGVDKLLVASEGKAFLVARDPVSGMTLIGTWENQLKAFDSQGRVAWVLDAKGPIRDIRFDPVRGRTLAGGDDRALYILDTASGKLLSRVDVQRKIFSLDINADASLVAVSSGVSSFKHSVSLLDSTGKELWKNEVGTVVRKIRFTPGGSSLVYGNDRAEVVTTDLQGTVLQSVKLDSIVSDLAIDAATGKVTVLTAKNTLYTLGNDLSILDQKTYPGGKGLSLAISSGLASVAFGTQGGVVTILNTKTGNTLRLSYPNQVTSINSDGPGLVLAAMDEFAYRVDLDKAMRGRDSGIWAVGAFSASGVALLLAGVFFFLSNERLKARATQTFRVLYKARLAYLLLIPTFLLLLAFLYLPVTQAFVFAFTDWNMKTPRISFIGFDNFRLMVEEGYFLTGLQNLLILVVTGLLKTLTIPLLVAELVFAMRSSFAKQTYRFLFVVPMVIPGIVMALMWGNIYDPSIGLLNNLLNAMGLGNLTRVWLGDPSTAIWSIVFMGFPFVDSFAFLIFYGALISIPTSLFDAGKVDGLKPLQTFWRIHVPLISSQTKMLVILSFIGSIQNFLPILILTTGGPGTATYVPGLELYFNATRFGRYGYASALGIVMFVAILIVSIINLKIKSVDEINE